MTRDELEQMWRDAPFWQCHTLRDGRRAVLAWTEQGTSLVLIDPAPVTITLEEM